jgi:isoaspartyl peptidase/L-asparaginase-like protein (Ntn-hydrolase superfamily)
VEERVLEVGVGTGRIGDSPIFGAGVMAAGIASGERGAEGSLGRCRTA